MKSENAPLMKCSSLGCPATQRADLVLDWQSVNGAYFCPDHLDSAVRAAKLLGELERLRLRAEELRRARDNRLAKRLLPGKDYRAWDEFQGQLADYHKKTGQLAPLRLRNLGPREWWALHRRHGRIDVETVVQKLEEADNRAQQTREWIVRRHME